MTYSFQIVANVDLMPRMPEIIQAVARSVSNTVKANLRDKDRNSRPEAGMPKSGYYGQAANAVTTTVSGNEATISIPKEGIRLHFYGGTVRPGAGKKALAIPVDPSVAMIWPSEAGGIATGGADDEPYHLIWPKGSDHGWIKDTETNDLLWLLVPKATIRADRSILPHEGAIRKAIDEAMEAVKP